MCGIAGVFSPDGAHAAAAVRAMNRAQAHRGPDDEGFVQLAVAGGTLALGHRRLAILDLSAAGHQPMQHPETGDWIVFNGEIYNFPALRHELEGHGARFRGRSDTEVILHAHARWGADAFGRLAGMFAIALFDRRRERLVLARDPFGIKPLYVATGRRWCAFASELRALDATGLVPRTIDRRALAGLLAYGAVPGPLTLRAGVRLLDPGTVLELDLGADDLTGVAPPRRFWHLPPPRAVASRETAVGAVRDTLHAAVRRHLLSDVPVAVFLSSGIDSTAIAALAAGEAGAGLRSYTIALSGAAEDEAAIARRTAERIGTDHRMIPIDAAALPGQVRRWLQTLDQPTVDGLNTYLISAAVRGEGIKVALSGLGGDELFGGYSTFRDVPRWLRLLRAGRVLPRGLVRRGVAGVLGSAPPVRRRKALDLLATPPELPAVYCRRRRLLSDDELVALGFSAPALQLGDTCLPPEARIDEGIASRDPWTAISVLESRLYMGNMLLRDADVFGMAHGLEIRVPLLDQALVDCVLSLPGAWRRPRRRVNKPLLADAVADVLPREVLHLPKRGFGLRQAEWMAGPLRADFEAHLASVRTSGLMEPAAVTAVWNDFLADTRGPSWSRAWMLGVLGAWIESQRASSMKAA